MEKGEDITFEKIKSAFHIDNLVDTDMHRIGTCNYYYNSKNEITEVIFKNYTITKLYDSITSLKNLTKLSLTRNPHDESYYFDRYGTDFDDTVLHNLPENFGMLLNLKYVDFTGNLIEYLPESIGNLTNLQKLILTYNDLKTLPETIGNLSNLLKLNLNANKNLEILPNSIYHLTALQELYLGGTKIENLSQGMNKLLNLKIIGITKKQTESFSQISNELPNLQKVIIYPMDVDDWYKRFNTRRSYKLIEDLEEFTKPVQECLTELRKKGCQILQA